MPIGTESPTSSAMGMNSLGATLPSSGSSQRSSASAPMTRRLQPCVVAKIRDADPVSKRHIKDGLALMRLANLAVDGDLHRRPPQYR